MKSMSEEAYARYQELLQEWRGQGVRVGWKEYRLAYSQAMEGEAGAMPAGAHPPESKAGQ